MSFINWKIVKPVSNYIKVTAPSTTANFGPGFDVFGLALDVFHDVLRVDVTSTPKVEIELSGVNTQLIPKETNKNTAGLIANYVLNKIQGNYGFKIHIEKGIPVGKGLGSSGASAAASAFALNKILNLNLSSNQIIELASKGEKASAGVPHADNVSAAILGGFTIIQSYRPLNVIKLEIPSNMEIALAIPNVTTPPNKTEMARSVLPKAMPLEKVIHNIGYATSIIAGIALKDVKLIGSGMVDQIAEPFRKKMVPRYLELKENAIEAGASGVAISGAGPSMIAVVDINEVSTMAVTKAMKETYENAGIQCSTYRCKSDPGVKSVEE